MRVMIADDSALFRNGVRRLLTDLEIEVLAAVGTGEALVSLADADPPDVAILDIRMPPTFTDEGLVAAMQLHARHPEMAILVLSTYAEPATASRLLADGARGTGYLLKDRVDDAAWLRDVLVRLTNGECVVDPELIEALVSRRRGLDELARLTEQERAVLRLMAEGHSNAGVGRRLFLSARTVETHVSSIFGKLDLPGDAELNRRVLAVLTWLDGGG